MAEERDVILRLKADTSGLDQGLGEASAELQTINQQLTGIEDELRNLSKEVSKGEAAKAFDKLNGIIEKNVLSIQELGVAADNFKNIALAAGTTSPIGQEALKRAAEMENEMDKLNQSVAQLAEGGRTLNATMQLGQGVIAGYTAFQGVTTLLGQDNEKLQETFVKLQAAQAALMGVKELSIALSRKGIIVQTAEAAATRTLAIGTAAYNAVVGTSTGLLKVFRIAMISTGIGALVVGIGLLIANFEAVSGWIKKTIDWFMGLSDVVLILLGPIGWLILAYKALFGETEEGMKNQAELLKQQREQNAEAHKERLKQIEEEKNAKIKAADEQIKALQLEKETMEANGESSYRVTLEILEHEKMKLQAVLDANNEKIQSWVDYYQKEMELSGLSEEAFRERMKNQGIDFEKLQNDAIELTKGTQDAIQRAENEITKHKRAEYEKRRSEAEKLAADQIKILQQQLALELALEEQITQLMLQNMEEGAEKELAILMDKHDRERDALIAKYGENSRLLAELETKQFNELQALYDKQEAERLKKEDEFQKQLTELRIGNMSEGREKELAALREKHRLELEEIRAKYGEQTELEKELLIKQKQELANAEAEFDAIDREEKIAKAQETLDTIQGYLSTAKEINGLLNELGQQEVEKNDQRRDEELSKIEAQKKAELRNENLTAEQKAQIDQKFAMQEYQTNLKAAEANDRINKRQFQRDKALRLAQIAIDTGAAVVKAIAMFGPPPSPAVIAGIASAGIIGGLQAAVVARQQFQGSAGSISPPDFSNVGGGASSSGGTGNAGTTTGSQQNNTTTDTDSLINGKPNKVILSMVELNEKQEELNKIDSISTIG